jgi:hypothetical protein
METLTDCQAEVIGGGGSLITISPRITTNISPRTTTTISPRIASTVAPAIDLDNTVALNNQANFANSIAFAALGSSATSFNGLMRNRASIRSFS